MKHGRFLRTTTAIAAIIYIRVSDQKQEKDGHGLESRELTCTLHADTLDLVVKATFSDIISGGVTSRSGMDDILCFIKKNTATKYVVIIYDISRFARDVEIHTFLRRSTSGRLTGSGSKTVRRPA